MERLRNCYDPEIPLNIVDLGLIYNVQVENEGDVTVEMTLTAQGCGMGTSIAADARQRHLGFGIAEGISRFISWPASVPINAVLMAFGVAAGTTIPYHSITFDSSG